MWHYLCTVTSIHSIQKSTRNSQKLRNKLVRPVRQWMLAEDWVVNTERNRVHKQEFEKKEKIKCLRCQIKKLIAAPCKQYKNCCWRTFAIRKCIYLHSAGQWFDSLMMKQLCTYWPTINKKTVSTNQRANKCHSRSSFTRSIHA